MARRRSLLEGDPPNLGCFPLFHWSLQKVGLGKICLPATRRQSWRIMLNEWFNTNLRRLVLAEPGLLEFKRPNNSC
jgi:hypothetical protein